MKIKNFAFLCIFTLLYFIAYSFQEKVALLVKHKAWQRGTVKKYNRRVRRPSPPKPPPPGHIPPPPEFGRQNKTYYVEGNKGNLEYLPRITGSIVYKKTYADKNIAVFTLVLYNPSHLTIKNGRIFICIPDNLKFVKVSSLNKYTNWTIVNKNVCKITFKKLKIGKEKPILEFEVMPLSYSSIVKIKISRKKPFFSSIYSEGGENILGKGSGQSGIINLSEDFFKVFPNFKIKDIKFVKAYLKGPHEVTCNQTVILYFGFEKIPVYFDKINVIIKYTGDCVKFIDYDKNNYITYGKNVFDGNYHSNYNFNEYYCNEIDEFRKKICYRMGNVESIPLNGTLFEIKLKTIKKGIIKFSISDGSFIRIRNEKIPIKMNEYIMKIKGTQNREENGKKENEKSATK